ncbi:MAG: hypothetical protein K8953_13170 [Proteobacteria bacterium]|nr:hypothetical protein [Pseudomonadota bacterium]
MERPENLAPLETIVSVSGGATGTQVQANFDYLVQVIEHVDAYNSFHEAAGVTTGTPLPTGVVRVADDGVSATTTTETPRVYNGTDRPFYIEDSAYV